MRISTTVGKYQPPRRVHHCETLQEQLSSFERHAHKKRKTPTIDLSRTATRKGRNWHRLSTPGTHLEHDRQSKRPHTLHQATGHHRSCWWRDGGIDPGVGWNQKKKDAGAQCAMKMRSYLLCRRAHQKTLLRRLANMTRRAGNLPRRVKLRPKKWDCEAQKSAPDLHES